MSFILSIFSTLKLFNYRNDDDIIDRFHYLFSKYILVALSILVSFKQFGGKPMECFAPDVDLPGASEQYIESLCWADNTYFVPFDDQVGNIDPNDRKYREINYYQWVPFFLLLQAACFQVPYALWQLLAGVSGINIQHLVRTVREDTGAESSTMNQLITTVSTNLGNALRFHKRIIKKNIRPHKCLRVLNLPYCAFYVTFMYFIIKFLYLGNVILQFMMINRFLLDGKQQSFTGLGSVQRLLNATEWERTGLFPRVTLCDFKTRIVGNLNTYTVQCVLVINIFNEKIFIFLWFWFLILAVLTVASIIYWMFAVLPCTSRDFIKDRLELASQPFDPDTLKSQVRRFVTEYLRIDGVFALRMISHHTSIIFSSELVASLWRMYYCIEEGIRQKSIESGTPIGEVHHVPPKPHHHWAQLTSVGKALFKRDKKDDDSDSDSDKDKRKEAYTPADDADGFDKKSIKKPGGYSNIGAYTTASTLRAAGRVNEIDDGTGRYTQNPSSSYQRHDLRSNPQPQQTVHPKFQTGPTARRR